MLSCAPAAGAAGSSGECEPCSRAQGLVFQAPACPVRPHQMPLRRPTPTTQVANTLAKEVLTAPGNEVAVVNSNQVSYI